MFISIFLLVSLKLSTLKFSVLYSKIGSAKASRSAVFPLPFSPTNTLSPEPSFVPSGVFMLSISKSLSEGKSLKFLIVIFLINISAEVQKLPILQIVWIVGVFFTIVEPPAILVFQNNAAKQLFAFLIFRRNILRQSFGAFFCGFSENSTLCIEQRNPAVIEHYDKINIKRFLLAVFNIWHGKIHTVLLAILKPPLHLFCFFQIFNKRNLNIAIFFKKREIVCAFCFGEIRLDN